MKKFKEFVNENIRDLLKGKSDEEVLDSLSNLNAFDRAYKVKEFELSKDFIPTEEELIADLDKLNNNEKIYQIIKNHMDYDLLPKIGFGIRIYYGNLNVPNYQIKKLPDNLTVNGYLVASNNLITEFPKNLKVLKTKYYKGDIYFSNNEITEIPENLTVDGDLYVDENELTEIPDNLTVNGDLVLNRNAIRKIGKNLNVGGNLFCNQQSTKLNLPLPDDARVEGRYENKTKPPFRYGRIERNY